MNYATTAYAVASVRTKSLLVFFRPSLIFFF